ncbi:MAG: DUF1549 domain-containing protein [Fuerstiella sp.]|nr:DUF1549 domain-containing protein [Fuerstiella sp.]MCP4855427.1 DUF1549 domain-containing protein [Fuerstiella sp.]
MNSQSLCFCTVLFVAMPVTADEGVDSGQQRSTGDFSLESKIRPVLVKHCYECHALGTAEGGLRVDFQTAIRKGGERGPVVVPKHPEASVLLTAISHTDPDLAMPPKGGKLADSIIVDFRKWVRMGAPDPRKDTDTGVDDSWAGTDVAGNHWAYQPVTVSDPPVVDDKNWPRNGVDRFVLATLNSNQIKPSPDASPRTLLRRFYFDLVGLPPSLAVIDRFVALQQQHGTDVAMAKEVDEQIDSLSRGVMASSVACARCHHHKFDPFTMEDYYGLAGVFASTETFFGTFTSTIGTP